MIPIASRFVIVGWVFLLGARTLLAHDTWVAPSDFSAAVGQEISFDVTSGMKFPALDVGPKPDRIAKAGFRLAAENNELKDFTGAKEALRFSRSFAKDGVATVWLQSLPTELELTDEQVAGYLDEARAPEEVRKDWERQKGKIKWTEQYIKCAKTAVAVGNAERDNSWSEPVGLTIEIVPMTNPTTLKAGQDASFKLLRDGKPLTNAAVALVRERSEERTYQTTNADGVATFSFPKSGKHLLTAMILTPPATEPPMWHSVFSTFTLEVR